MNIPDGLLCAKTHEYILTKEDYVLVGITDIMLDKLGEIIFVEFPEKGSFYSKKENPPWEMGGRPLWSENQGSILNQ